MITTQQPLDTTSGHCQKSPLKTTTLPPKGESRHCMMSHKVQSITSAQCQCCVGASSQMISFASRNNSAKSLCTGIEHIESLPRVIGILKLNVKSIHLPIGKILRQKRRPQWQHVRPVEPMPITRYI